MAFLPGDVVIVQRCHANCEKRDLKLHGRLEDVPYLPGVTYRNVIHQGPRGYAVD